MPNALMPRECALENDGLEAHPNGLFGSTKLGCVTSLQPDEWAASIVCDEDKAEAIRAFPMHRQQLVGAIQDPATSTEDLWRKVVEDPAQWRDLRRYKRNLKEPDFRQAETGDHLSINQLTPIWVQAKVKSLQEAHSRTYSASGLASNRSKASLNFLWPNYFKDPIRGWDNRKNKLHRRFPDSRHKCTKEALWINDRSTPHWVTEALKTTTLSITAGKSSFDRGTSFDGEYRPATAVELQSSQRSEYFWTQVISQHTKSGQGKQALKIYEAMQRDGVEPSPYTFVALLKACGTLKDLEGVRRIHAEVNRTGLQSDLYVVTALVDVYAKCKSLRDARDAFEKMPQRNVVSWTALIMGYAQVENGEEALQLYTRMQQEGVVPNDRTYVSALKACSTIAGSRERNESGGVAVRERCLEIVRAIHRDIMQRKFESDVFVGTMLVDVYTKCGSLEDARCVFEKMQDRNVVSWNAMILGYAQMDKGEEAMHLYTWMQQEGVVPDARTYLSALKACSVIAGSGQRNEAEATAAKQRCLDTVRNIHADVLKGKFESDIFLGNMLVDVYAKSGSLEDASRVFEKMPQRDVVSWNAMISGYAQMGKAEEALQVYTRMQLAGAIPNDRTYVSALKACSTLAESAERCVGDEIAVKTRSLETVRAIHLDVVKGKFESGVFIGTMLVDAYAKCGRLEDARSVFENMPRRDVASWTAIILGYAQMDKGEEGLQLYTRMQKEGVVPDHRTYVSALKACSTLAASDDKNGGDGVSMKRRCLYTVRAIHANVTDKNLESDKYVANILVDAYAKCGSLEDARHMFEKLPDRTVVSWNTMISGYAQMDKGEEALHLYTRMQQEGVVCNDRTYVSALKACSALAASDDRNGSTGFLVKRQCLETVRAIHATIRSDKFDNDLFIANMLVDVYAKCGSLEDARHVFEMMPERTVVSWNAMILGYAQMNKGEEALQLYTQMQQEGVVPDGRSYVSALKACSTMAESGERNESGEGMALKESILVSVRSIHTDIVKRQFESDVFVGTMLIDAYAKYGSLEDARSVFEKMPDRSVVSWNAMILGYAEMAKGEEALDLYMRMKQEGVSANDRTYVSVLKACSTFADSRDWKDGGDSAVKKACLETVRTIHADIVKGKFEWDAFVGNMLVDVYAKCGSLKDARGVFETMPQRDVVSWNVMILAHALMDKGEEALKLYTRMQQENVVPDRRTYVVALNACGSVAGLEKGKEIHAQILAAGLEDMDSFVTTSLIYMYGKCGSMMDAQRVFDAIPARELVAWNALVVGYAHQGESDIVFDLFQRMKQEGVKPDEITFLGILTVCSHLGLVNMGQEYFNLMRRDYGIAPTIKHFTCIIDLLGRSGQLDKAMEIVQAMPFQADSAVWECVLGACQKWGDIERGKKAFECAVRLNKDDAAAYVLMSNIYAAAHMQEESKKMQAMRLEARAWKQPGRSQWTDLSGISHEFVVGDHGHPESQDIYAKLGELLVRKEGYVPHLDSVLQDIPDDEDAFCGHSEKLAIALNHFKEQPSVGM